MYLFRLFSGLWIVQIWSINYALHLGNVKICKHCLYWCVFSTQMNRKIIFNCLLLFKLFLLVSKWVRHYISQIFSGVLRNWGKVYIWRLLVLSFMRSSIPIFQLALFIWSVNCSSHFLSHFLLVSKLHELSFCFWRCPEA